LTLAAASTAFVPDLLDAAPPTLITLAAPTAPSAIEVADLRASAAPAVPETTAGTAATTSVHVANSAPERSDESVAHAAETADSPIATNSSVAIAQAAAPVTPLATMPATGAAGNGIDVNASPPAPLLVSTVGDSSMMFMNAGLAAALGPERWQPVPTEFARWTDGTGGFDRHGCGPTGDSLRIYFSQSVGPHEPRYNHPDEVEQTCDWRRWIPGGLELAQPDVVVASWGPTTMWGWERDGQMVDLTDPVIRASVKQAYSEVREAILAAGVQQVIWVAYPPIVWRPYFDRNQEEQPWSRPAVADELFELLTELGDPVVDLRDMADPTNFGDGLHFTDAASAIAARRIVAALPADDALPVRRGTMTFMSVTR